MDIINQEDHTPQKPKQVTYAFYLILSSTAISFLVYIANTILLWHDRFSSLAVYRILWVIPILIDIWLAFKINSRRNWARSVFIILTFLGLFGLFDLPNSLSDYPVQTGLSTISFVLSLLAAFLLLQKSVRVWFKSSSISESITKAPTEAREISDKPPQEKGPTGFKKEAPSTAVFVNDWKNLNNFRRVTWVLRIVLYLAIIGTLFLPWYETDMGGPGSGWILGLDLAGWSCGIFFTPYIALLIFGMWSILRPGGQIIWAYRASLFLWLAYTGLFSVDRTSNYMGPIVSLTVTVIALIVEAIDFAIAQMINRKNPI